MSVSNIVVNGISASFVEVPINVAVNISNDGDGAESSILWSSITGSQPSGTFDGFVDPTAFATTITPRKEGNYLLHHTIDGTLTGSVILAVKFLKSDLASAAAGEKTQFNGETGWARNVQALHSKIDNLVADGGTVVGFANETLTKGQLVRVTGSLAAKSGLPGEELTPVFALIAGEATGSFQSTMYIIEGPVTGSTGDTTATSGSLVIARLHGLHGPLTGTAVDGNFVWPRADGVVSTSLSVVDRKIGTIVGKSGTTYYINFDGTSDFRPDLDDSGIDGVDVQVTGSAAASTVTILNLTGSGGIVVSVSETPAGTAFIDISGTLPTGDVVGPAISTDNAVARFNLATGKLIQDSSVIVDDADNISGISNLTASANIRVEGQAGSTLKELTQAGTINTDANRGNVFEVNLTGSAVLANPINLISGHTYIWLIKQPMTATGSLTYGSSFVFPRDITPTLTVPSGSATIDAITTICSGSTLLAVAQGALAV